MTDHLTLLTATLLDAAPAAASAAAQVPEASSAMLFALGALGVMVGRKLSMHESDRDD